MQGQIDGREAIDIIGSFGDTIVNSGQIIGGIFTDGGNDSLTNTGTITGHGRHGQRRRHRDAQRRLAGDGNDCPRHGNDTLTASSANAVTVDGGAGDDHITGGAGNDDDPRRCGATTRSRAVTAPTPTPIPTMTATTSSPMVRGRPATPTAWCSPNIGDGPITLYKHGNDLEIVIENDGKITVTNQFAGGGSRTSPSTTASFGTMTPLPSIWSIADRWLRM